MKKETPTKKAKSVAPKGLTVDVVSANGSAKTSVELPKEVFGEKVNEQLMAQAVRVYLANQREGSASTKTRGDVEGSTRKIFRQKGTGNARHGSIRAPIFVGGGIVFGPVPHSFRMSLPAKMRRKARNSALTQQFKAGNIVVVDGLTTLTKTKDMAKALAHAGISKSTLVVVSKSGTDVVRFARNIEGIDVLPVSNLHTYAVLMHTKIVFMKDALTELK